MRTWAGEGESFKGLLAQDAALTAVLSTDQLDACFDPERLLRNLDPIFDRVFKL